MWCRATMGGGQPPPKYLNIKDLQNPGSPAGVSV